MNGERTHAFREVGCQSTVTPMGYQGLNQINRPKQQSLNCFAARLNSTRDTQFLFLEYYQQHSICNIEWQGNITNHKGLRTKLGGCLKGWDKGRGMLQKEACSKQSKQQMLTV